MAGEGAEHAGEMRAGDCAAQGASHRVTAPDAWVAVGVYAFASTEGAEPRIVARCCLVCARQEEGLRQFRSVAQEHGAGGEVSFGAISDDLVRRVWESL